MGFLAAAIPIATSILGAMSDKKDQQPQQAATAPPTLGEIFAANTQAAQQQAPMPLPGQIGRGS